jgi:hypothetical protein
LFFKHFLFVPVVAKYFAVSFHHLKQGGEGVRGRGGEGGGKDKISRMGNAGMGKNTERRGI